MRLITRELNAKDVAKRWGVSYPLDAWPEKQGILSKLIGLGDNPKADDIDAVIGNTSWTRTECHECGAENVDVIQLGQEPDYESCTANVCRECLKKALDT